MSRSAANRMSPVIGALPGAARASAKPSAPPTVSAVLYARVSSKDQEKEGFSIPAQQKLLRGYAADKGFAVAEEFVDVETAKRAGRTNFGAMLAHLKKHKHCRTILVEKTDRLYRNLKDWVELDGMNLEIHLVKENIILSEDSRSNEKFIHGIKVLMAKNFIDNLSEEAKKGLSEKAQQGIWPSRAPLGYLNVVRLDGKHVIEPDPAIGPVIRRVFDLYATGNYSLVTMVKQAKLEGLSFRRSKQPLPRTSLHTILQNLTYTGDFMWHGVRYHGIHTPLITNEVYERVQAILEGRALSARHDNAREFAFSGLIRCGLCARDGAIHLLVGELHKGKYIYYRCEACKRVGRAVYLREDLLDSMITRQLRRLRIDDDVLDWMRDALRAGHDAIVTARKQAVARLQDRVDRLQTRIDLAYDDRLDGRIDAGLFEHRSHAWRDEQSTLRREIAAHDSADQAVMDAAPLLLELAKHGLELYESQTPPDKRRFLNFLCSNFIWTPDEFTAIWRQPFDILAESSTEHDTGNDEKTVSGPNFAKWQGQ